MVRKPIGWWDLFGLDVQELILQTLCTGDFLHRDERSSVRLAHSQWRRVHDAGVSRLDITMRLTCHNRAWDPQHVGVGMDMYRNKQYQAAEVAKLEMLSLWRYLNTINCVFDFSEWVPTWVAYDEDQAYSAHDPPPGRELPRSHMFPFWWVRAVGHVIREALITLKHVSLAIQHQEQDPFATRDAFAVYTGDEDPEWDVEGEGEYRQLRSWVRESQAFTLNPWVHVYAAAFRPDTLGFRLALMQVTQWFPSLESLVLPPLDFMPVDPYPEDRSGPRVIHEILSTCRFVGYDITVSFMHDEQDLDIFTHELEGMTFIPDPAPPFAEVHVLQGSLPRVCTHALVTDEHPDEFYVDPVELIDLPRAVPITTTFKFGISNATPTRIEYHHDWPGFYGWSIEDEEEEEQA
jgi:hypothetical protein